MLWWYVEFSFCMKWPYKGHLSVFCLNLTWLLCLAAWNLIGFATPIPPQCMEALGMKSGDIPDSAITASSSANAVSYAPSVGRLHFLSAGSGRYGSWAAGANNAQQWFQVNFGSWTKVTAIRTQGRQDSSQWVKTYSISYSYDSVFHKTVYNEYGSKKVRNCYRKSMGKVPYRPSFLL